MPRLPGPGRGLGPRLHQILYDLKHILVNSAQQHDDINLAFNCLEQAVLIQYPRRDEHRQQRTFLFRRPKKLENQLARARRKIVRLETSLKELTQGHSGHGGQFTPEFLAKVALSIPTANARAFASSWQDLVGVGASGCCRAASASWFSCP